MNAFSHATTTPASGVESTLFHASEREGLARFQTKPPACYRASWTLGPRTAG